MEFHTKLATQIIQNRTAEIDPVYINEELFYLECNPEDAEYMNVARYITGLLAIPMFSSYT